ncbi:winged helix-turn-helix transcriptional regulator [Aeromonas veronii]
MNKHTGLADGHVQIASDIAESLNLSLSEVEKALEELERAGFIQQEADVTDDNGNDVPGYTLDELGRKYLGYKKSQLAA